MNNIKIKPCPFCNSKAEFKNGKVYNFDSIYIRCTSCFARSQVIIINLPSISTKQDPNNKKIEADESTRLTTEQATQKAAKLWNRRTYERNQMD